MILNKVHPSGWTFCLPILDFGICKGNSKTNYRYDNKTRI